MPDPRWQRIEQLYHGAAECAEADRAHGSKAHAGRTNGSVRKSRICFATMRRRTGFLEGSALTAAAASLAREGRRRIEGSRLGGYEVQALLGEGGMGEVYRARDVRSNATSR